MKVKARGGIVPRLKENKETQEGHGELDSELYPSTAKDGLPWWLRW